MGTSPTAREKIISFGKRNRLTNFVNEINTMIEKYPETKYIIEQFNKTSELSSIYEYIDYIYEQELKEGK